MIDTSWKWRMPRSRHLMPIKETKRTKAVLITVETVPLPYGGMIYNINDDKNHTLISVGVILKSISIHLLLEIYRDMWNDGKIDRPWYNYYRPEAEIIEKEFREIVENTHDKWIQEETIYGVPKYWKLYFDGSSIESYREVK